VTSDPLQPPQPPSSGWPAPTGPTRPLRLYLGLPLRVWVLAWLPLVPVAFLTIAAPGFFEPMADPRVSIVGLPPVALFLFLPLINLAVARVTRNEAATLVAIAVTSFLGMALAMLAPAIVLIVVNLST
jgi:hypothetical protein